MMCQCHGEEHGQLCVSAMVKSIDSDVSVPWRGAWTVMCQCHGEEHGQ